MKLNRFATFSWAVLGYTLVVIVWGALVRATGSGAGCGSHWPLCNGEVLPKSPQLETLIEFVHRLTSGLALPASIALAVWAYRAYPRGSRVRAGAVLAVLFMVAEALVGAGLVRFELVADNASIARAIVMSFHLANTFLLIGVLTLTAWWASGGQGPRLRGQGSLAWLFALALASALVLGVSGAVAALGDTLFPAESLAAGLSQDFSPTAHVLIRLRILHPLIAVVVSGYLLTLAGVAHFMRPAPWTRRFALALASLLLVQIGAGLLNLLLLAPVWLQLLHLFLADLAWIALVLLMSAALAERVPAGERDDRLRLPTALEA